jgi:hypothetical protein
MSVLLCHDGSASVQRALSVAAVQSRLLGSVSYALVHHAHRPVVLMPTPDPTAASAAVDGARP